MRSVFYSVHRIGHFGRVFNARSERRAAVRQWREAADPLAFDVCAQADGADLFRQRLRDGALRKLSHSDGVLYGRPAAFECRVARAAGDSHHRFVKRRRKPAIEAEFLLAVMEARFERAEIEKPQVDRYLA